MVGNVRYVAPSKILQSYIDVQAPRLYEESTTASNCSDSEDVGSGSGSEKGLSPHNVASPLRAGTAAAFAWLDGANAGKDEVQARNSDGLVSQQYRVGAQKIETSKPHTRHSSSPQLWTSWTNPTFPYPAGALALAQTDNFNPPPGFWLTAAAPRAEEDVALKIAPPPGLSLPPKVFDRAAFRRELTAILRDLEYSQSTAQAVQRMRRQEVPVERQADEFVDIITRAVEVKSGPARRQAIAFAAGLPAGCPSAFDRSQCKVGIQTFFSDIYDDLCEEVPRLSLIVLTELLPTLRAVFHADALDPFLPEDLRLGKPQCRHELTVILTELSVGIMCASAALEYVRGMRVPKRQQAAEFANILFWAVQISENIARRDAFNFVTSIVGKCFKRSECALGLTMFREDVYAKLCVKVPYLQCIWKKEVIPALRRTFKADELALPD